MAAAPHEATLIFFSCTPLLDELFERCPSHPLIKTVGISHPNNKTHMRASILCAPKNDEQQGALCILILYATEISLSSRLSELRTT